jgi:hypothetical protein
VVESARSTLYLRLLSTTAPRTAGLSFSARYVIYLRVIDPGSCIFSVISSTVENIMLLFFNGQDIHQEFDLGLEAIVLCVGLRSFFVCVCV